ncbi:MAG: hypothetical protein HYS13_14000 [Planctomycetia bacterium]|nr:hypothetical protein [Planctomycetia bacterium]
MPHPDEIRALVLKTFLELAGAAAGEATADGAGPAAIDWGDLSETILIRGGAYFGRCYRAAGLVATLASETERLDFFDWHGRLLTSIALPSAPAVWQPTKQAA